MSGQQRPAQTPVFRSTTDLITTTVVVRDAQGRFVPDLRRDEFRVFEDGVPQTITGFSVTVGGRVVNGRTSPLPPGATSRGLMLPPVRTHSPSGRIFIIFIDDLHLEAALSPRVRRVLEQVRDTVLHEGDLVAYVSTGYSSIASDLSYDPNFTRFTQAINKVMGSAPAPQALIAAASTSQGPVGIRYNAHVAFSTAYDLLGQLAASNLRRKAFIYVSSGYDFDPFKDARFKNEQAQYDAASGASTQGAGRAPFQGQPFADAELVSELFELTRAARQSNVTFYTLDPRGLVAGPDINDPVSPTEFRDHIRTTTSSLQVLGDETGGFCICGTNDFTGGLQRIDNDMSDAYVIGYVSNNPDPLHVRRAIEIRMTRPNLKAVYVPVYRLDRRR